METIVFFNLKGGVGKTSTAVNIAHLASKEGISTLLWDLDPQGSSSWYFDRSPKDERKLSKLIRGKTPIGKLIQKTDFDNLDIIPCDLSALGLESTQSATEIEKTVSRNIAALSESYSLLVIDCPPNATAITESILLSADAIYIPLIPTHLSMQTYSKLKEFIKFLQIKPKKMRPFFSLVDRRKSLHKEFLSAPPIELKRQLAGYIPYCSEVEKMGNHRTPIAEFASRSPATLAYRLMWDEIKRHHRL